MLLPTSNNDTSQSLHSTTIAHNSDNGTLALSGIFFMRQSCPVSLTMEPDGCGPRAVFFCSWVICSASSVLLQRLANLPDMGAHHFTGTSRDTPRQCETLFRLLSWQPGVIATHRLAALMAFFFCIFFCFMTLPFGWIKPGDDFLLARAKLLAISKVPFYLAAVCLGISGFIEIDDFDRALVVLASREQKSFELSPIKEWMTCQHKIWKSPS